MILYQPSDDNDQFTPPLALSLNINTTPLLWVWLSRHCKTRRRKQNRTKQNKRVAASKHSLSLSLSLKSKRINIKPAVWLSQFPQGKENQKGKGKEGVTFTRPLFLSSANWKKRFALFLISVCYFLVSQTNAAPTRVPSAERRRRYCQRHSFALNFLYVLPVCVFLFFLLTWNFLWEFSETNLLAENFTVWNFHSRNACFAIISFRGILIDCFDVISLLNSR